MMRKGILLAVTTVSATVIITLCYRNAKTADPAIEKNIGFYDQWLTMKANSEGKIPRGLHQKWYNADARNVSNKKGNTGLKVVNFIGPSNVGGRTRDLLIDRADDDRLIACAVTGGLWESNDGGYSWKEHNDLASSLIATTITQNPFNPKEIYYGTGEVVGSADLPGEGIFKSTDGGKNYSLLSTSADLEFDHIWDIEHSTTDSTTFYVSVQSKGLYRSTNSGKDFQLVFPSNQHVHDIEVFDDGSVMFARQSKGIFFSESGDSNSWSELTQGLPTSGFYRIELSYSPKFPEVIYALYTNGVNSTSGSCLGVWKSSNGGKNWTPMSGNPDNSGGRFLQPYYTLGFSVDPNDTNFLVVGCTNLTYSTNGGISWTRGRDSHADYHAFIFHPSKSGVFYACNDGGIYEYNKTTVRTRASDRNQGYNVTQYYAGSFAPDSLGVIGGTQDNGSHYHRYGSSSFSDVLGGDGAFCHISQQDPDLAYTSSQNGMIYKSTRATFSGGYGSILNELDEDFNWTVDDPVWFINPFEMNYQNGEEVYFVTKRRIWHTLDAGESWRPITSFKANLYSVGIPNEKNPSKIYIGGQGMLLLRVDKPASAVAGNEVNLRKNVPTGLTNGFIANIKVHPRNSGIVYLGLSDYSEEPRIWRVEDADTDNPVWVDISGNLPDQLPCNWVEVDPYRPDSVFFAGTDFGLYTTQDAGNTWVKEDRMPNVAIHQIRMRNSDRRLFIYTHGRGIWHADLESADDLYASTSSVVVQKLQVFPNPTTQWIKLGNLDETVTYHIYDLQGKQLITGQLSPQQPLDVSTLPNGNYFIKASQASELFEAQFVKQ